MIKPLAVVVYKKILPGSQLVNRLQDLDYRVLTLSEPADLLPIARREKPLIIILALEKKEDLGISAIIALKKDSETTHIPILAFSAQKQLKLQKAAIEAGANLVASDTAILAQLPHLLAQLLGMD